MRIYSMTATFGKLEHDTLTLQPGLNVIEAPNEWGKSTWCAFLVAMLYGIETRVHSTKTQLADKEHYAPWSGSPMAGRIDLHWNGRDITIERRTKGRTVMGDFRAYETASGLTVPELTADNCGKLLLGVEKSVFTRTGFIRLNDMPVTQDEALRRRLNDLVTTGDESGQSDDLSQKLKDLKNRCRSNRANGLIPQALNEKADLDNKLQQLDTLQFQCQRLTQRQAEVADFTEKLKNHKQALAWESAQRYAQKAAAARQQLAVADAQVRQLESSCADLPAEEVLQAQAAHARQLQARKDSLQLEIAMLPSAPVAPETPAYFQGMTPEQAVEQTKADFERHADLIAQQKKPAKALVPISCVGLAIMLIGMVLLLAKLVITGVAVTFVGWAMAFFCFGAYRIQEKNYKENIGQVQTLTDRYAPLPPDSWVRTAEDHARKQAEYAEKLSAYEAGRATLQQQLQQVLAQIAACPGTDGHSAALEKHRVLADARREQQHLAHLVQTLEGSGTLPEKPTAPDSLTYDEAQTARLLSDMEVEARQLHSRIGQLEGQMQSLGSRQGLEAQLTAVADRLARLEQTYRALELAQNTLAQASTALQRRFAPAIAQQARVYFSHITAQRYDKLALTDDLTVHTAARDEDTLMSSLWRSDGTADQLYLALRLAVADALTPEAPLVLDDALVRFDDTRLMAAMQLLKETAENKQVILFTCQNRESTHM